MRKMMWLALAVSLAAETWTGSGSRSIGGIHRDKPWKITYRCTSGTGLIYIHVFQKDDLVESTNSQDGEEQSTDIEATGEFRLKVAASCKWEVKVSD